MWTKYKAMRLFQWLELTAVEGWGLERGSPCVDPSLPRLPNAVFQSNSAVRLTIWWGCIEGQEDLSHIAFFWAGDKRSRVVKKEAMTSMRSFCLLVCYQLLGGASKGQVKRKVIFFQLQGCLWMKTNRSFLMNRRCAMCGFAGCLFSFW